MGSIRILVLIVYLIFAIVMPGPLYAQELPFMSAPGAMVSASNAFIPVSIKGIKFSPEDPLKLSFIIDAGDSLIRGKALQEESNKLIKYFLTALTVPANEQWVNLSPLEAGRITTDSFGQTQLGRDLLAQDYLLKQFTSSLMFPEKEIGNLFWEKVYEQSLEQLGTTDIPVDILNKVWIVPQKAVVYQNENMAYVVSSHLKVMTETDYLSLKNKQSGSNANLHNGKKEELKGAGIINSVLQEVIIPEIEREINEGIHFHTLRQMYDTVILATWFKRNLKESILGKKYVNKNKLNGVYLKDFSAKEKIYNQYIEAYKVGTFRLVKEDYDFINQAVVPRKYVAGGLNIGEETDKEIEITNVSKENLLEGIIGSNISALYEAIVNLKFPARIDIPTIDSAPDDMAMVTGAEIPIDYKNQTIKSGQEAVFRLVVDPKEAPNISAQSLRIVTNMGGTWEIYKDALELAAINEDGSYVFEAKSKITVNRNHEISYTFFHENEETGKREWINLPGQDGKIQVVAPFQGRVATISMEYLGPLGQAAGGQGDVVYGKNTQIAKLNEKENAPISIIPFFKANANGPLLEKHNQFEWEKVEGFEENFVFKRKGNVQITAIKSIVEGVEVYKLISGNEEFFNSLYSNPETEFYESILLSKGGVALLKHLKENLNVQVDIVESNDHHTSLVLPYMRGEYNDTFKNAGHLMLLHNIGYQGQYDNIAWVDEMGLPEEYKDIMKKWNGINMLAISARMLAKHNRAVTVSPRYALETLKEYESLGFIVDKLLAQNPEYFIGLLNGLADNWNPQTDKILQKYASLGFKNYHSKTKHLKKDNKTAFQKMFSKNSNNEFARNSIGHLVEGSDKMLIVSTNRLQSQKNMDLVKYQIQRAQYEKREIDFVIIGSGAKEYEDELKQLAQEIEEDNNSTVNFVFVPFNNDLERLGLAAADGCLAPSDFEPGGLAHLKGMLYGAVPFVRWTGGLADTVDEKGSKPSGWGFSGISRTFSDKTESAQVKGVLSYVNWQEFIYEVDRELAKLEAQKGKFEFSDLELFEAIGRAFQKEKVLNIANKEDKDKLFWEESNGITNGWAITHADTVKKAVNERQFYRAIMRGLDVYENERNHFNENIVLNSMEISAYWSNKIDGYFKLYEELKEAVNPPENTIVEAEFETGNWTGAKLINSNGSMEVAGRSSIEVIPNIEKLEESSDYAMASKKAVGGIDFNTENLSIETQGIGPGFNVPSKIEELENINFEGLFPEIIEFNPILNLPALIGKGINNSAI